MKEELKKHPIEMSIVIVYAIMKSVLQVAMIALRALLVDAVVQLDWQLFLWMIGAQVLLKGLQSVVIYLKTLAEEKVVQKVNTELRIQIVESMKQASYSEVTQREVPEYVSWMSNDMERIAVEGIPMFVTIIESIVTIVLSVAVLWTYHWSIVAAMVVSVSAMVMIPKFLESKTKAALSSYSQLQSRFVANLQNLLEG